MEIICLIICATFHLATLLWVMYMYHKMKALERAVNSLRVHYKRQVEEGLEQANRPLHVPSMDMLQEPNVDCEEVPVVPPNSLNSSIESSSSC